MVFIVRCPFAANRPAETCSKVSGKPRVCSGARSRPGIFLLQHSILDFDILPHRKLRNGFNRAAQPNHSAWELEWSERMMTRKDGEELGFEGHDRLKTGGPMVCNGNVICCVN